MTAMNTRRRRDHGAGIVAGGRWPLWLLPIVALATSCATAAPAFQFHFTEERVLMANGVRAVVLPDDTTDYVSVAVRYPVGKSADPTGKAGLAHLVTHLTYRQRPLMDHMRNNAASYDATTDWDSTEYVAYGRKENLESVLQTEATRLSYGCEAMTQEQLDRERDLVRDELRELAETPEHQVDRLLYSSVYPPGHPYLRAVDGDSTQLDRITLDDVCAFMDRHR